MLTELRPSFTVTRSASSGISHVPGVTLNRLTVALFLAERRPSYVQDVFQPLEFHGAVHAQVRPGAAGQGLA